ncbi:MAG TPA: DUF488 domain-containing protein [Thermomicrobiales bacterium]|nr:DUF488 domain-containing protein [Thermomicrobiales bacterium]
MSETPARVWTTGYQGHELEEFLATLRDAGITMLVDVRRRAQSRKRGFGKTALKNALSAAGIAYEPLRYLGMPVDLMPQRNLNDNTEILTEYRRRLEATPGVLDELRGLVREHRVCLLCFEADSRLCHRSVLANLLGVEVARL